MEEELQLRIHGEASLPTLVFLPGLHGDWTLIGGFRSAVAGRARFVEFTYPARSRGRWTITRRPSKPRWQKTASAAAGCWANPTVRRFCGRWSPAGNFRAQGAILAGGFVKHPLRWAVRLAEKLTGRISDAMVVRLIFAYAKIARFRYRRSPETLASLDEFIARRTRADRRAAQHRLHLIAENDPRSTARRTRLPVFGLTGVSDPIVPWPWVRRWLGKHCPALRDYKIIWSADHNVLSTAPRQAVKQVLAWMALSENGVAFATLDSTA